MRILITGICGFVGSTLARGLIAAGHQVTGFDNFIRPGSETNRAPLEKLGAIILEADLRDGRAMDALPAADFVVDAAANPSVLAGVDGKTSSRELVDHNLTGTINVLEYCKAHKAGFILLSTSRVYSIPPLVSLPLSPVNEALCLRSPAPGLPPGVSAAGLDETFATTAPVSLYGATKLASEAMALEYGETFGFPVFVNRCGVMAGAGQFGRADQGIFAYWINAWLRKRPLKYLGFGGLGHQVRDCLHPRDLLPVLEKQFAAPKLAAADRLANFSGGAASAMSLRQLSDWCARRFGPHLVVQDGTPRPFDIGWMVLDHAKASRLWQWQPTTPTAAVLEEIATHAEQNPGWLELSAPR
ncbi:NAD-dependent epimerase/dehydratase family protein [Oleiharenicola lentus]|uniref:NAD-dependent epimerase/dehydratase family protein n=1 Tax=Oleiharenicola lentus TaxID=2508720 RepID=A0A4Q1C4I7_9BACT|nr:NAD-dependent epimerase/dehydratase family protein [Oleiharenicola lentus]RXK53203.1 NAD-dependent epimerase/dehydratase family protein [Oleiharenicola lentus]